MNQKPSEPESPQERTPEAFLSALKPVPEYRGPEYWYRHLAALDEERQKTMG